MTEKQYHEDPAGGAETEPRAWLFRGIVSLLVMAVLIISIHYRPGSGIKFVAALATGLYGAVALVRFVISSLKKK